MFGIFSLICLAPLKIFKSTINSLYFNLAINLNFLLIISLLPLQISKYAIYVLIVLIFLIIKNYHSFVKNIKKIKFDKYRLILIILTYIVLSVQVASQLELGWDAKWFWHIKSLFYTQNRLAAAGRQVEIRFPKRIGVWQE